MIHLEKIKEPERYLQNAKDFLKKAGRENGYYLDKKYVRTACGTAYNGVLLALEEYLISKNRPITKKKHQRKNVDDYKSAIAKLNKKLLHKFEGVYHVLHLDGYYDGILDKRIIDAGMTVASEIISGIDTNKF